jgi:hypothetical protein
MHSDSSLEAEPSKQLYSEPGAGRLTQAQAVQMETLFGGIHTFCPAEMNESKKADNP